MIIMASDSDDFFADEKPTAPSPRPNSSKPDQSKKRENSASDHDRSTDYSSDSEQSVDQNRHRSRSDSRHSDHSSSSRSRDGSLSSGRSPRHRKKPYDKRSRSRSSGTDSRSRSRSSSYDSRISKDNSRDRKGKRRQYSDSASCSESEREKHRAEKRSGEDGAKDTNRREYNRRRRSERKPSSGSDMTDVSSMSSPRYGRRKSETNSDTKPPRAPGVYSDSRDTEKTTLDLTLLSEAVSELEKETGVESSSNLRRVGFEAEDKLKREKKSNYTFSERETRRIEQENHRLLKKIMCQFVDSRYTGLPQGPGKKTRVPASGINRLRDHHRIEKENLSFLKRLQQIKPTKGLSRTEQLSAYSSTLLHGIPIPAMHPPAPSPSTTPLRPRANSHSGSLSRTRSVSSIQSASTWLSSLRSCESASVRGGKSRPRSAKVSVRERPPWDERW